MKSKLTNETAILACDLRRLRLGGCAARHLDQDTPFQEFIWGDYFRTFMSRRLIELEFELAVELAIKPALLAEAEDLPGFFHMEPRSRLPAESTLNFAQPR